MAWIFYYRSASSRYRSCYSGNMQPEQQGNYWQNPEEDQSIVPNTEPVEEASAPAPASAASSEPITWEASEYIHNEKSALWIMALLTAAAVLVLVAIFLIKSWTFVALIIVMTIALIVMARRPPRIINYALSVTSLRIEEKTYGLHEFRSFGVVEEGAFYSVRLIPIKRFMPAVSLYFAPELGERIVDTLGSALPMQRIEPDFMDKLLEKIHF